MPPLALALALAASPPAFLWEVGTPSSWGWSLADLASGMGAGVGGWGAAGTADQCHQALWLQPWSHHHSPSCHVGGA